MSKWTLSRPLRMRLTKMDSAVVDAGGNLEAFARMDGAWLGSIDISQEKARTARFFDLPSEELGKLSQPGGRSTRSRSPTAG